MLHKTSHFFCIALACSPIMAAASSIQRCEDNTGNITFTSLGCPNGHDMQWQEAYNAPPGTTTSILPGAEQPEKSRRSSIDPFPKKEILVVGQRDDGCGNRLSAEQRRRAIINEQTPPGMTRKDAESLLGRPDKVTTRNGETRYVYHEKKGRSSQVTFDENDCVKGKR